MDAAPSPTFDPDELRADIRRQVRAQQRIYFIVVAVVSLVVGGLIVRFTTREDVSPGKQLTPPPYWGQVCVAPTAVAELTVSTPTATSHALSVYVSGAVAQPGVVTLPVSSLLSDALTAAGGASADADLESINLAAPLSDNQHVIVPRRAVTPQPAVKTAATAVPVATLVNINTATAAELEMLPHIGPAMAQRIIAYRETNGPFQRIEDLQKVEGIGETRYKDLAPLVTVE